MKTIAVSLICALLVACGSDTDSNSKEMIDVTPANAHNIVTETGAKVDAAIQQNKESLDAAIDAQSNPSAH